MTDLLFMLALFALGIALAWTLGECGRIYREGGWR